ncbi:MAG: 4Fe-4S dicluster domain-containing protein [Clostridiales bacterium]|nr:4Fe-4S dicluster domain-containing protein [Clostridiales bacterium]MCF8021468.1 4Fe-4S dicluster domain-containing protein [Clostridiales bacterium]
MQIKHTKEELVHEPVICQHCKNPYCLAVCPVNAIKKDKNTGAVTIDSDRCTGCGICMKYCYLGAIYWSQDGLKAVKCDLCGGDPVCVKECPTGALEFIMSGGEDENG